MMFWYVAVEVAVLREWIETVPVQGKGDVEVDVLREWDTIVSMVEKRVVTHTQAVVRTYCILSIQEWTEMQSLQI